MSKNPNIGSEALVRDHPEVSFEAPYKRKIHELTLLNDLLNEFLWEWGNKARIGKVSDFDRLEIKALEIYTDWLKLHL